MRLSDRMQTAIKQAALNSFGDVKIYLFGSRVDDSKSGGDIDLAFDVGMPKEEFRRKKSAFLASLIRAGFDLKIDIVQYDNSDSLLFNEVRKNMIKLNFAK